MNDGELMVLGWMNFHELALADDCTLDDAVLGARATGAWVIDALIRMPPIPVEPAEDY